jgi:MinD-like ATPase involved in chromosome partitioning or flagellar assembly
MSQDAWSSAGSRDDHDDTSDRMYTPEDLAEYAARRDARAAGGAGSRGPAGYGDPLTDPLTDPIAEQPADPAPYVAPAGMPTSPPPSSPPPSYQPPVEVVPVVPAVPAAVPVQAAPPTLPPASPPPSAPPVAEDPEGEGDVRRFMSATDFLDRRDADQGHGPATWGWRGKVRKWSGGMITPRMGPDELAYELDRQTIQKDFDGPRTIAFINPKGGAAKTTGVLAAGYTFGTVRGGGVVAWDNNETRGTLGIRGTRSAHRNTTRELLEDLERFTDVYQSRIGDLGAFVRSQGDAHFDVLASDERPDVTGTIRAQDFDAVHKLLERFYRIILIDTGNNMRAENWLAAAGAADLLVVTSTVREDTGYSGLWMLDALQDAGYQNLKYKTVTILSDPSPTVDAKLAADLVDVYQQRTRGVYRVPYDPALVAGSVVPYSQLSENTRRQWLKACAGMAEGL